MKLQNKIYTLILVIVILMAFSLLLIYYTQNFKVEFNFDETISMGDVEYSYSGDYINSIATKVGTLKLSNRGYFSEVYSFPVLVGCINLKESNEISLSKDKLYVKLSKEGNSGQIYSSKDLEIPVDGEKEFNLIAIYSPHSNQVSLKQLEDNAESISIYKLNKKEKNPFGNSYSFNSYQDCAQMQLSEKPIEIISLR